MGDFRDKMQVLTSAIGAPDGHSNYASNWFEIINVFLHRLRNPHYTVDLKLITLRFFTEAATGTAFLRKLRINR